MATKLAREPRDATRLLEPGPLALVTSRFRSADNVMTAAWLMPVSLDPPLVALAIHPGRLTHEYVSRSEFFALNIPNADLLSAAHYCGMESGRSGDKFSAAGLTPVDALELDAPLIDECVAHIECGVVGRATFGDHDLFIGAPLAVSALDEAFDDRWLVETDAGRLLHHLRADYYAALSRPYQATLRDESDR
ncbi:MAG TPA: flavin reductase family protein [Thermomicrobiales bacterium]|nr:flavin reductase family protein [Thermomicrobiales bacterium]